MKTNEIREELLEAVAGGEDTGYSFDSFINAMNQVDGKKCKYCGYVFSADEIIYRHKSDLFKYNNDFLNTYNKEMLPCLGCGRWRYVDTDFK